MFAPFQSGIREILSRDSFCAAEVEIFRAVTAWMKTNRANVDEPSAGAILSSVRLSLMSTPDLLKVVRPTGLVPPDVMLDAIQSRTESRDMELKYRGYLSK
jgi:BTB/POZ domain-containing protein 9